jgi:hypothetical protein
MRTSEIMTHNILLAWIISLHKLALLAQHREIKISIEKQYKVQKCSKVYPKSGFWNQVSAGLKNTQHIDNKPPPAHQICWGTYAR